LKAARILVTGASGAIGHTAVSSLREQGHFVRGFDRQPAVVSGEHHVGDLCDILALRAAARGMEIAIHLAGVPERENFAEQLVPNNIVGTHNLLEVARLEGLSRVVYASSCRVVGGLDWHQERIGLEAGLVPGDHYGISKATGELLARMYSERFGISVIAGRFGWYVRNLGEAQEMARSDVGLRLYLSHRDAATFFRRSICAENIKFAAVFVTSLNGGHSLFDLKPAAELLGYEPQDSWPDGSSWSDDMRFASPVLGRSLLPDPH
jgi:uronate dehydrogenase